MTRVTNKIPPSLRVETIMDRDELDLLAPAWDALAVAATHASPLASHAWFATQIDENHNLRRGGEVHWRCLAVYAGDRLVGVMPLIEEHWDVGSLRGPLIRVPGEYYLRSGKPLVDEELAGPVLDALLDSVRAWRPGVPVELEGFREGRPGLLEHVRALKMARTRPIARGQMIATDGDYGAWFCALGRSHRKNLDRRSRRLEEAFPREVRYHTVSGPEAAPVLEDFARLEMRGWKGNGGKAMLASPSKMHFYRRLCVRLAQRGWLEWHVLEVAGKPIVIDMWVRMGHTLAGLFTAYDEDFAAFSPGALRLRRTVEEAFASDIDIVDVLTANPWTEHWGMQTYRYHRALIATGNPLPLWLDDATFATKRLLQPLHLRAALRSLRSVLSQESTASDDPQRVKGVPS